MTMTRTTRTFLHSALHPALLPNSPSTFLSNLNLPLIHLTSFSKPVSLASCIVNHILMSFHLFWDRALSGLFSLMSSTYSFLLAFLHSKHAHVSVIEEKKLLLPMTPFSFFSLPRGLRGDLTVSFSFVPQPPAI